MGGQFHFVPNVLRGLVAPFLVVGTAFPLLSRTWPGRVGLKNSVARH
jgi:hypothetical protein